MNDQSAGNGYTGWKVSRSRDSIRREDQHMPMLTIPKGMQGNALMGCGFSTCPDPYRQSVSPVSGKTTNRRAGCGRPARPVRREGCRGNAASLPLSSMAFNAFRQQPVNIQRFRFPPPVASPRGPNGQRDMGGSSGPTSHVGIEHPKIGPAALSPFVATATR
jgi:hypothetical protein